MDSEDLQEQILETTMELQSFIKGCVLRRGLDVALAGTAHVLGLMVARHPDPMKARTRAIDLMNHAFRTIQSIDLEKKNETW